MSGVCTLTFILSDVECFELSAVLYDLISVFKWSALTTFLRIA